jgi:hypothetical protein
MSTPRQVESAILRALAEHGQATVAGATGISETKLSRFMSDGGLSLSEVSILFTSLGLAVFDTGNAEVATVPREELNALRILARRGLA